MKVRRVNGHKSAGDEFRWMKNTRNTLTIPRDRLNAEKYKFALESGILEGELASCRTPDFLSTRNRNNNPVKIVYSFDVFNHTFSVPKNVLLAKYYPKRTTNLEIGG